MSLLTEHIVNDTEYLKAAAGWLSMAMMSSYKIPFIIYFRYFVFYLVPSRNVIVLYRVGAFTREAAFGSCTFFKANFWIIL